MVLPALESRVENCMAQDSFSQSVKKSSLANSFVRKRTIFDRQIGLSHLIGIGYTTIMEDHI